VTLPAALAELPLTIDGYELERLELPVSPEFTRVTTVVHVHGGGEEGVGEDVTYSNEDHDAFQAAGPAQPVAGGTTFGRFAELVAGLDLFPVPPQFPAYRLYRRWAFESAALDLALRQAGRPLHEVIGRDPQPVRFVNSLRLGDPATIDPVRRRLELYPWLEFKLDATSSWTDELVEELAATGAVESVDLKGRYSGTTVDQGADAALYRRVAEGFPDAWIEDPALTPETEEVLAPHWDRVTWDEPIHSIADLEALPHAPTGVNLKPSRIGSLAALLETYDYCAAHGIRPYGGGQFELGPGRGQIQYLASLFHPASPNDIAPRPFNERELRPGLPQSPLEPAPSPTGFRWNS
jgi:L-alanine-DL-glutamate epimerase-like enolase superfamily enzyme